MAEKVIQIAHCRECVELIGDYVDGLLPPEQSAELERHLSLCMPCITFVRTYKATSRLAREKLNQDMPEELVASLHNFLGDVIPGFTPCNESSCGSKVKKKDGGEKP